MRDPHTQTPADAADQVGGVFDPTPSTDTRYLGYVGVVERHDGELKTVWMPPVLLVGPQAAWDYARAHGGHAEELRITDQDDAIVLHVGRDTDGIRRLLWPTAEMGVPPLYIIEFDQALRTGTIPEDPITQPATGDEPRDHE